MNNALKLQKGHAMARRWKVGFWLLLSACAGIGSVHAQTVEYIHTDALGTPVAVTDANRNVIERREYEPYGALLNHPISDGPGYTGHVMDAATGLTYMQQRYYDPWIGRFLSVDPVTASSNTGGNFNRYWYANNNPYKFFDPDGRIGCTGTRIQSTCDSGGVAGLQTSARSPLDTGANKKSTGNSPAREYRGSPDRPIESVAPEAYVLPVLRAPKLFAWLADALGPTTTVIGRVKDLQNLRPGERSLLDRLPNRGGPQANWQQNAGVLRHEMSRGNPIRDASPGNTGGAFLNAERNLLQDRGWTFNARTDHWTPPAP